MSKTFRLTSSAHHGLLLMSELATRHKAGGYFTLEELAQRAGLSQGFLEQVAAKLKKAKLIVGRRGQGGGYRLTRDPRRISVAAVLSAIEGPPALLACLKSKRGCPVSADCSNRDLWSKVQTGIDRTLRDINLSEVAGGRSIKL